MRRIFFGATLAISLCIACSKPNAMVGTWKMDVSPQMAQAAKNVGDSIPVVTMVFNSDNTFDASVQSTSQTKKAKGKYELKGKELTLTATDVDGKPAAGADAKPSTVTLSDDMSSFTRMGMTFKKQ